MLPYQRSVNARFGAEHVHQQQNGKRNEKAQPIEVEGLMVVYHHRIQANRITGILAHDLDTEILDLARALQVQKLALLAGGGNIDLGNPERVLGGREIGFMGIVGEADLDFQVLCSLGVVQVEVDIVHHLVKVVEINGRVRFGEFVLN